MEAEETIRFGGSGDATAFKVHLPRYEGDAYHIDLFNRDGQSVGIIKLDLMFNNRTFHVWLNNGDLTITTYC